MADRTPPNMLLRARLVLPVTRPAIDDGAVRVSAGRITFAGRFADCSSIEAEPVFDLGNVILLPGLVNAHCHLDYTDVAGQILPTKSFTDWIKAITVTKNGLIYADFARAWLNGAKMLLRTGTTTVADIESVPELLPEIWDATPLRFFSFLEMTGVRSRREPEAILRDAVDKVGSLRHSRNRAGLSPHAPYSTVPELLRLSAVAARDQGWRMVIHVAESNLEFEMLAHARGGMFDWLQRNGRDMSDCGLGSPVRHLERNGCLGENLLAVHANYLTPGDAEMLGRHQVSVAHCPRSHAFFQHCPFPYDELVGAGVNVCLGTDSLATVATIRGQTPELSLFAEMKALAERQPSLAPETILRMATVNGARALGMSGQIGELSEGAFADLIAIPFSGATDEAGHAVVHFSGDVMASWIDGEWGIQPPG